MYIEKLTLENVRTFVGGSPLVLIHPETPFQTKSKSKTARATTLPRPQLPNVNLLLGDNGSGKSTVLRAIAAAAFGPAAKDLLRDPTVVRSGEKKGSITANLVLHKQDLAPGADLKSEVRLERIGERLEVEFDSASKQAKSIWGPVYESKNDAFFVVGYGATRRVERLDSYDSGARSKSRSKRDLRVQSLFEDSFSLIPLGSWLPDLQKSNPGRHTQVVHLIERLLEPGQFKFDGERNDSGDYLFSRGGTQVAFQSLSDGYRAFIGWVADLLYHVCFGSPSGKKLVESQGIVLVDEIDLHLHPKWQMEVIPVVARALPNMQFVFTSHSPLVASSLEWMNIITLKTSDKTNKTTAKRLKQSVHGLDADQMLISDFFGLESTVAPKKQQQLSDLTERIRSGDTSAPLLLIKRLSSGAEEEE